MQRDLGIAALAFAIVAIFTPFGAWLTIFVAFMAAFAYGEALRLGIASIAVNLAHIVFFSQRLWEGRGMGEFGAAGETPFLPWILIAAQVVGLVILLVLQKRYQTKTTSS
jgi:hypothetical protein